MQTRKSNAKAKFVTSLAGNVLCAALTYSSAFGQYVGPAPTFSVHSNSVTTTADLDHLVTTLKPPQILLVDDRVAIQVYGVKEFDFERLVGNDGTISLPLIGPIVAKNKTVDQLQSEIADLLRRGDFVQDPQVTARITSQPSLKVTVTGEVDKPGTFSAMGSHTLSDYLAQAGGLKSSASTTVTLVRPSLIQPVAIPLGVESESKGYGNIPIFPGDEIRVGKIGVIYAVGALKNQGSYPLKNSTPTSVIDAIALAGGIGYEAAYSESRIYRTIDSKRVEIDIDVNRIMHGKAEDIALKPDDILFIPSNQVKAAVKGGGAALAISLASAYIYAH